MLTERFAALRAAGRRALVCYVTAGHPDPERSIALWQGLEAAGADVIEVGVPFSDPVADGPVIQASSQVALSQGMTLDGALELVSRAQLGIPVVLFSYLNPMLAAGPNVLRRAAAAGVHGVLVTDLPVGADPEREAWLGGGPLDFVRLVAPTTPRDAWRKSRGTGAASCISFRASASPECTPELASDLPASIARLRSVCPLPICVGFGISTPEQARAVGALADGIVVGSAIVQAAGESVDAAVELARRLRAALDEVAA